MFEEQDVTEDKILQKCLVKGPFMRRFLYAEEF